MTELGKNVIKTYYAAAPYLTAQVEESPRTRDAFVVGASLFAALGRALE